MRGGFRRSLWILLRWPLRAWLHRRCLRRIAALERKVFPEYFEPSWQESLVERYEYAPGTRWLVNDSTKIEWLEDTHYKAVMCKHNLLRSALYASTLTPALAEARSLLKAG